MSKGTVEISFWIFKKIPSNEICSKPNMTLLSTTVCFFSAMSRKKNIHPLIKDVEVQNWAYWHMLLILALMSLKLSLAAQ
jgi:hypothetical protein